MSQFMTMTFIFLFCQILLSNTKVLHKPNFQHLTFFKENNGDLTHDPKKERKVAQVSNLILEAYVYNKIKEK